MLQPTKTRERDVTTLRAGMVGVALALSFGLVAMAATQSNRVAGRGALLDLFERTAPAVGDQVPDLPVYDRDGQASRLLALLHGRYTVLILGCLT